jgi:phosphatidylethanolamine/phosphatidyl-N-methylethanolamine N-methyltransferase
MTLRTFAMEAMTDFLTVGAIAPSSRYLTHAMVGPIPLANARVVVEVGAGTGVMTQALLDLMPADATLLAFEINARFARHLRCNVLDPRLQVINARAETLQEEVRRRGFDHVDAVVSSLALGFMAERQRNAFLGELGSLLGETGVFTQFQYLHRLELKNGHVRKFHVVHLLRRYFRSVQQKMIWRNLPPAFVFACQQAVPAEAIGSRY